MRISNTTICCLPCRQIFRKPGGAELPVYRCSFCSRVLIHAGSDFKAPKATERKAWAVVERHLLAGHVYWRGNQPPEVSYPPRSPKPLKTPSRPTSVFAKPKRKRAKD